VTGSESVFCVHLYWRWRSNYQRGRLVMSLTIKQFSAATCLCLCKARTRISNVICHGLFYVQWDEVRCGCSFIWFLCNCWPSMFSLSFHNIIGVRDRMVVGFTTTYAINVYHHWCCEFASRSGRGVQHYVIKFVSDLRQVGGFHRVLPFPPPIKLTTMIKLKYCWKWRLTSSNKNIIV